MTNSFRLQVENRAMENMIIMEIHMIYHDRGSYH